AAAGEPASPANAERRVFRRCANAASTTAKTWSRVAVLSGGRCRVRATSAESTFGAGQNTERPIEPTRRRSQCQRAFTDGTPYVLEPGAATSRSATSAWTITSSRRTDSNVASRCSSTGTATLYGRLATTAVGAGPGGSSGPPSAPAVTTSSRPARSGARSRTVVGSAPASTGSTSTATTR